MNLQHTPILAGILAATLLLTAIIVPSIDAVISDNPAVKLRYANGGSHGNSGTIKVKAVYTEPNEYTLKISNKSSQSIYTIKLEFNTGEHLFKSVNGWTQDNNWYGKMIMLKTNTGGNPIKHKSAQTFDLMYSNADGGPMIATWNVYGTQGDMIAHGVFLVK